MVYPGANSHLHLPPSAAIAELSNLVKVIVNRVEVGGLHAQNLLTRLAEALQSQGARAVLHFECEIVARYRVCVALLAVFAPVATSIIEHLLSAGRTPQVEHLSLSVARCEDYCDLADQVSVEGPTALDLGVILAIIDQLFYQQRRRIGLVPVALATQGSHL